ncbi:PH domain-containing protein [Saccharopolyspora sp. TS4A08]|uniref:PH domain-containing protein n=1 Tax=Saccharopolyspora ipomoeae TaxID=3042027 RepID=A0ABT6PPK0_9PSEU|nr:PH domain-containing protein [Saccharopolyspora sp. TS4A08]MDI2029915.1 PH domain-containing protein [Saccharopolyspora sp. TS4A08]
MNVVDGQWHRLDVRAIPASAAIVVAPMLPTLLVMTLAGAGTTALLITVLVGLGAALLIVGGAIYERVFFRYRITEERFEQRQGGVFRNHRSIPRERIRTVDITAAPHERLFGIATVKVSTGAQADEATIKLQSISREDAESLRRGMTLGDGSTVDDAPDEGVLSRLEPRWLGYSALTTSLMLVVWGAIGSAVGSFDQLLRAWGVFEALGGVVVALGIVAFVLVVAGIALVVGVVGAFLLSLEMWWGYQLTREPGTLRVKRGLLTTRSLSLEERRLRGVELGEPLPLRLAGGARLGAVATGLQDRSQDKKQPESKTLLPPAPRAEARRVAAAVLRDRPFDLALTPHPRAALRRRIGWALWSALGVAVVVAIPAVPGWIPTSFAVVLVVLALAVGLGFAVDAHRGLGHALDERYLVARNGSAARSTVALQRENIIGWRISRTVFQRRADLMTVGATTAAGSSLYRVYDVRTGDGLALADEAVPGLLTPFLEGAAAEPVSMSDGERPPN